MEMKMEMNRVGQSQPSRCGQDSQRKLARTHARTHAQSTQSKQVKTTLCERADKTADKSAAIAGRAPLIAAGQLFALGQLFVLSLDCLFVRARCLGGSNCHLRISAAAAAHTHTHAANRITWSVSFSSSSDDDARLTCASRRLRPRSSA